VPDPALPAPLLPSVMVTGSILSPPPGLPALAWPSITELMAAITGRGKFPPPAPAPPCAPAGDTGCWNRPRHGIGCPIGA